VDAPPFSPDFARAFVAVRYFLGARGVGLGAPLGDANATHVTEAQLGHPDRERRATALAAEVGRVVRALEARNFR
jgi:hypothetical protein